MMEMKLFESKSVSVSEIVHLGRTYSSPFLNFKNILGVKFSPQICACKGIVLKVTCASTSDNTYLPEKAIGSIGQGKLSLSYRINGTNGTSSRLYCSDNRVLHAFDDEYGGVIVDPERLPANPNAFVSILHASLSHWKNMGKKGVWLKLPVERSELVPIAVKVLVVQEKHRAPASVGLWKIPTGFVLESEEIFSGAIREVKEETGIDTEFVEVIAFRHAHNVAFEKSDLFFICMLRPLSTQIIIDDLEIQAAKWMPLVDFVEQPLIQEDCMFKKIIDICIARLGQRYCGLSAHKMVSKFDGQLSSLYYNVVQNQDFNCGAS
ncbi:hypothetical protein RGQ29_007511 [Quercus rubra]|uniref:Nudix hydrolase domain-containing protein n=1 Tax=Quercus rubra TaxID=3512 RepID=A0AAN7I761_QUERU|nr:hypothetical protein RGQ29_007511 [Quercus rubra]